MGTVQIREKEAGDEAWVETVLNERWGARGRIVVHGQVIDACTLPALIAGAREGIATFRVERNSEPIFAEIVTLDALASNRGIGTALVDGIISKLRAERIGVLRVTTTNDNLNALRFYQKRGFHIVAVRPGAVDISRRLKPEIPLIGEFGIPIRDEIDLEQLL